MDTMRLKVELEAINKASGPLRDMLKGTTALSKGVKEAQNKLRELTAQQKQAMLDAARPTLMRILGPNCVGLLAPHARLNASFAHIPARPGELAFVSQSGALVTAMLDWAEARQIG